MEKKPCLGCGTLIGKYICLNCAGDPQHRQNLFEGAYERLLAQRQALRDEFAMRVLPTVIMDRSVGGSDATGTAHSVPVEASPWYTEEAYRWADLMLKARLPESG